MRKKPPAISIYLTYKKQYIMMSENGAEKSTAISALLSIIELGGKALG